MEFHYTISPKAEKHLFPLGKSDPGRFEFDGRVFRATMARADVR